MTRVLCFDTRGLRAVVALGGRKVVKGGLKGKITTKLVKILQQSGIIQQVVIQFRN